MKNESKELIKRSLNELQDLADDLNMDGDIKEFFNGIEQFLSKLDVLIFRGANIHNIYISEMGDSQYKIESFCKELKTMAIESHVKGTSINKDAVANLEKGLNKELCKLGGYLGQGKFAQRLSRNDSKLSLVRFAY